MTTYGDGRGLRVRKCPDTEPLGDEGGGSLVDIDDDQDCVAFEVLHAGNVDRTAIRSVALIVRF